MKWFAEGKFLALGHLAPEARAAERDVRVRCFHVYALTRKSTLSFFKN
jgi:hypothetical protein